jgi:hypothetical protein
MLHLLKEVNLSRQGLLRLGGLWGRIEKVSIYFVHKASGKIEETGSGLLFARFARLQEEFHFSRDPKATGTFSK